MKRSLENFDSLANRSERKFRKQTDFENVSRRSYKFTQRLLNVYISASVGTIHLIYLFQVVYSLCSSLQMNFFNFQFLHTIAAANVCIHPITLPAVQGVQGRRK